MDGTSGQKDNPQPQFTTEQRMQSMLDLSHKFGGSSKIPEGELTAIGYVKRVQEDGTIRLLPYERMVELSQKDPDWEKPLKTRERPFERIAIELPTSERGFRHIPIEQKKLLTERLVGVEYAFYPN